MYRSILKVAISGAVIFGFAACGSDSSSSSDSGSPATPAESWTVSGTVSLPAGEAATHLRLVVSSSITDHSTDTYASDVVALSPSGDPPSASFTLNVDASLLGELTGPKLISIALFNDENDNGNFDAGEDYRGLRSVDASCGVWGDGSCASRGGSFSRMTAGSSGSGSSGDWQIDVTGWYYEKGCDGTRWKLITTEANVLTGAKLEYNEFNTSPIATE